MCRLWQAKTGYGKAGQGRYLVPNQVGVWPTGVRHGVVDQAGVAGLEGAELGHVEVLAELAEGGHVPRQVVGPVVSAVSALDMVASYGRTFAYYTQLGKCTFLELGWARMDACCSYISKDMLSLIGEPLNHCIFPQYCLICTKNPQYFPKVSLCLPLMSLVLAPNTIENPF